MANAMRRGNITFAKTIGYSEIYQASPLFGDLANLIHSFSFSELLMTLARMNILLFKGADNLGDLLQTQQILTSNFLSQVIRNRVKSERLNSGMVFHRHTILRLLHLACLLSPPDTQRNFESPEAIHELGRCFLMMNDILATDGDAESRERLITEFIPLLEYANTPDVGKIMVRARTLLQLVGNLSSRFDMDEVFRQATGLAMDDHQHIIFGILGMYLHLSKF